MSHEGPLTVPFAPGDFVRLPAERSWGLGQVQSVAGARVTVNFEGRGKVVVNAALAVLEPADPSTEK